ncbi:hypothetical protein FGG08_000375 [Glutinoglossum americanum]|uniref:Uncharacterized protein n=1 Tax=Glutinoglossum americanum TaxID=1670608 RepID=A0A9P8I995_9PEZI|nr:hypothetical protein FGG08_000375 [Glutinoglossum americanum]
MAIWPFRHRSRRNKSGAGGNEKRHLVARHDSKVNSSARPVHKLSKNRRTKPGSKAKAADRDPNKAFHTYSRGLAEKFPLPLDKENHPTQHQVPGAHVDTGRYPRVDPERRHNVPAYFHQGQPSHSNTSIDQRNNWQQLPTLKGKRSAASDSPLNRRDSRKKRKENNHAREEEIRSMSASASLPSRSFTAPFGREGHRRYGGLGTQYRSASEASLSFPESMHSSLSSNSEGGFIVKSLDLLSPRPRLRYSEAPSRLAPVSRSGSRRDERRRTPLPEEAKQKSKTIDDLADDLDASGLRELMERDHRRREKKRILEAEKMQRRLLRRAEKQKAEEEEKMLQGQNRNDTPTNVHRGAIGRDGVGLGIGEPPVQTREQPPSRHPKPARRHSRSPISWLRDDSHEDLRHESNEDGSRVPSTPSTPAEHISPPDELEGTELETAQAVRLSVASVPPTQPSIHRERPVSDTSNLSSLRPLSTGKAPEPVEANRRESDPVGKQQPSSRWTVFFRRSGAKSKRPTDDPGRPVSQFSTSRDSIPHPTALVAADTNVQRTSGPPIRTTSRFREDLPESSASHSQSKIQSVSAPHSLGGSQESFTIREGAGSGRGDHDSPSVSTEAFTVAQRPGRPQDPFADTASKDNLSTGRMSPPDERAPSAALSQSLASIDSEGSWLSGKPSKRNSVPLNHPTRSSGNSLPKRYGDYSDSAEELGLEGDEYYTHLSPGPGQGRSSALRESGTAIASSEDGDTHMRDSFNDDDNDEEGDPKEQRGEAEWKDVVSRQPILVHRNPLVKSREGLLNEFQEGAGTPESMSPTNSAESPQFDYTGPNESPEVRRATSVDLGKKHARHMSAGSAKLLEVQPSTRSAEHKRVASR